MLTVHTFLGDITASVDTLRLIAMMFYHEWQNCKPDWPNLAQAHKETFDRIIAAVENSTKGNDANVPQ